MGPHPDVLVVCSQPAWPLHIGWRVRVANLIDQMRRHFTVHVASPPTSTPPPEGVRFHPLPPEEDDPKVRNLLRPEPHFGNVALGPVRRSVLGEIVKTQRPSLVLYTDSPLAAVHRTALPTIVDFANIELHRYATFLRHDRWRQRPSLAVEALKAARWEPRVCRSADVVVALTHQDAAWLRDRGGNAIIVPNAHDTTARPYAPSPEQGPVTYVASADYEPNRDAGWWVLREVWPRVLAVSPHARLRIVGRAADRVFGSVRDPSVSIHADVPDVAPFYADASVVLAPVRYGAGSQLKVSEALGHHRMLVATAYSSRSLPQGSSPQCVVANSAEGFAASVADLYESPALRHRLERQTPHRIDGWEAATAPLIEAVRRLRTGG